ncbi:hypothetical protein [Streptomyces sp. 135]|uniref:hypothetical protein n=1 Tax=Streptomyces sp. 135 TaxID=2838850 RepID=UPI001CBA7B05|nr:hypothetical protein [Streptomyces sp. 135]
METYLTFQPGRRGEWQGHEAKSNVRNVIRTARRSKRDLHIFVVGEEDGWPAYTKIPAADWDTYFAEEV